MALRHVDPTTPHGIVRRGYIAFFRTPPGRWTAINVASRVDPWLLSHTGGRVGMGLMITTAVLEAKGAKSGRPRTCTVLYFHDGDDVILVASSFGREKDPAWSHNLKAHPDCRLGDEPFTAAVVADEAERDRLWGLADRVYPGYADYRARAGRAGRTIQIFRLTPA
ncbi:MAG TPA: nitroreductase/quinone reductase family protein [Solirubrobacteraceae bacterium]|nr:nitroreductase/quinone reductase family protein [Solirubrobacteraceae bacterium]